MEEEIPLDCLISIDEWFIHDNQRIGVKLNNPDLCPERVCDTKMFTIEAKLLISGLRPALLRAYQVKSSLISHCRNWNTFRSKVTSKLSSRHLMACKNVVAWRWITRPTFTRSSSMVETVMIIRPCLTMTTLSKLSKITLIWCMVKTQNLSACFICLNWWSFYAMKANQVMFSFVSLTFNHFN